MFQTELVVLTAFFTTMLYFAHGHFVSCPFSRLILLRNRSSSNQPNPTLPAAVINSNEASSKPNFLADIESGAGVGVGATQKPKLRPLRLSLLADKEDIGSTHIETVRSGNGMPMFSGTSLRRLGSPVRSAAIAFFVAASATVAVCGLIDSSRVRVCFSDHFITCFHSIFYCFLFIHFCAIFVIFSQGIFFPLLSACLYATDLLPPFALPFIPFYYVLRLVWRQFAA